MFVADNGAPIANALVSAFTPSPCCSTVAAVQTDSLGSYVLVVPPGTYLINFQPPTSTTFAPQYWNGMRSPAGATRVTLAGSSVDGIDGALVVGFTVSGIVTDAGGAPVANAWVTVSDPSPGGGHVRFTRSDGNGGFAVYLVNGIYSVNFYPPMQSCCPGPPPYSLNITVNGRNLQIAGRLP